MKFAPMTTELVANAYDRVVHVTVTHDPAQSYSRAVIPKARKVFKRYLSENYVFAQPVWVDTDYHDNDLSFKETGRAKTTVKFSF